MSNNRLSAAERKEIEETLAQFGLDAKESSAYLALLSGGPSTTTPLSQRMKLPATTVQSVLERLATTGLVGVSKRRSRRVYEAFDPKVMKTILEEKLRSASSAIPLLERLRAESGRGAKIKVYFHERAADIFNAALAAESKTVYEIVSAEDLQEILGEKFHFTRRRKERGVRLKSLRVEAHEIKKYSRRMHREELREAKFLPRELTFRMNVMFWDDTVAFFAAADEGLAWTVESRSIREAFQQIFAMIWETSRTMETLKELNPGADRL